MKKKTVAILAPTGMLGSMIYREFKDKYHLILVYRSPTKLRKLEHAYGGTHIHKKIRYDFSHMYGDYRDGYQKSWGPSTLRLITGIGKVDAVINCAGITKPHSLTDPLTTFFVNGALPNILSQIYGGKLIQIATDCVFSGLSGAPYDELAPKSPTDLYGLSKSVGEPSESLVLRTSIFGPEIDGFELFLEWYKKQKNKKVYGFTNHLWTGVTTKEYARICDQIIQQRGTFPQNGVFHIFSTPVSKYEMLRSFEEKYHVGATIIPIKAKVAIDRRLQTKSDLCRKLKIPKFDAMLEDL